MNYTGGENVRKWICMWLCALLLAGTTCAVSAADYTADETSPVYAACEAVAAEMDASHIFVYNYTEDTLLYSRTLPGGKVYPASVTKLFSAYVALGILDPEEIITVGTEPELVESGSSIAFLGEGQQLTVTMLVEGMLLPSGNDAAMVLSAAAGRRIAGDDTLSDRDAVDAFVTEMNRQAKELDFEKSHFANPDGYHAGCHYTSVPDLVRISRLALENPTISTVMGMYEVDELFVSGQSIKWTNTNLLLQPEESFYHPDAIGMKTGYTSQAGNCLVSAFRCGDNVIVVGILGARNGQSRFVDAVRLLDAWNQNKTA